MNYFQPQILSYEFPNHVRGTGRFTPFTLQISGWGFLIVKVSDGPVNLPYKKWLFFKQETIELDIIKGQTVQIQFVNLFGRKSVTLKAPSNNSPVSLMETPQAVTKKLPTFTIKNPKAPGKSLVGDYLKKRLLPYQMLESLLKPNVKKELKTDISIPKMNPSQSYRITPTNFTMSVNHQELKFSADKLNQS